MLLTLLFLLFSLSLPTPTTAQIPLSHLLIQSYKPSSKYQINHSILGASDTNTNQKSASTNPLSHQLQNQDLPTIGSRQTITIAILGDSMIDALGDLVLFKNALKQYYPNKVFNIINYGLGASHIEYGLYRLQNQYQYDNTEIHPSLLSRKPDIVVIESFAYNNFGNNQSGIDKHWLALGAITTKIKEELPQSKIVLTTTIAPNSIIFANGAPGINLSAIEKIQQTNTINLYLKNTINFATSQHFVLADAYTPSLKNNDGNPVFINRNDGIHPNHLGAQFFSGILAQTIEKYKLVE